MNIAEPYSSKMTSTAPNLHIIMGPAGSGKTSIPSALSTRMSCLMIEADDHHPQENVDKMRSGTPLTDLDRIVWLDSLIAAINAGTGDDLVLACSALTPYVQSRLRDDTDHTCHWWLIDLPRDVLDSRMRARKNHFMPADLLDSQLASLTPPSDVRRVHGDQTIDAICDEILAQL
ncbi:MAG: gluconokinase, GntK/IdnK-type [Pseudomonadota bacterium]